MLINLSGNPIKGSGYNLPEDAYEAQIVKVGDLFTTQDFNGNEVEKFTIGYEVQIPKGTRVTEIQDDEEKEYTGDTVVLTMFCTPKVTKGSGTYSNSKLYDVLEKLKLIDDLEKVADEITDTEKLVEWVKNKVVGIKCKVLTKNSKKGKSHIEKVVKRIVDFGKEEKKEKEQPKVKEEKVEDDDVDKKIRELKEQLNKGLLTEKGYQTAVKSLKKKGD